MNAAVVFHEIFCSSQTCVDPLAYEVARDLTKVGDVGRELSELIPIELVNLRNDLFGSITLLDRDDGQDDENRQDSRDDCKRCDFLLQTKCDNHGVKGPRCFTSFVRICARVKRTLHTVGLGKWRAKSGSKQLTTAVSWGKLFIAVIARKK